MAQTVKAFQQHAENFLVELKVRLFDGQVEHRGVPTSKPSRVLSVLTRRSQHHGFRRVVQHVRFVVRESPCFCDQKVNINSSLAPDSHLSFSVCDEPNVTSSSDNQAKIQTKIQALNDVLKQLFQRWAKNLSHLREISVAMIQFGEEEKPPERSLFEVFARFVP